MATQQQFGSFQEMLAGSELPVLVDFYATWCGPCQLMANILQQVNGKMSDRLKIVKIDTDKYPALASQYGVQALPTLVLFKDGQQIDRVEGVLPSDRLIQRLQQKI